jgi:tryptophanyl-tRNA synthetase
MVTDPARIRRTDPGHPDVCTAFTFHQVFNPGEAERVRESCVAAGIGCVECKRNLGSIVSAVMAPHYERRAMYAGNPSLVSDVIHEGARKARAEAQRVMAQARDAMKI